MAKKYIVRLTEEQRQHLKDLVSKGKAAAAKIKHAHILLKVDADGSEASDEDIAKLLSCSPRTVFAVRQRFVEQGLEAALERQRRERPPCEPILDGEKEARLLQLACSTPPNGRSRWTLKLLADTLVTLEVVEAISPPTVMRALKKMNLNRINASIG